MHQKREISPFLTTGIFLAMLGLVWGFFILGRDSVSLFEARKSEACVAARVVDFKSGQDTMSARAYAYFVVELSNGRKVTIDDYGSIPPSYRGEVTLKRERGEFTGSETFRFAKSRECKGQRPIGDRPR